MINPMHKIPLELLSSNQSNNPRVQITIPKKLKLHPLLIKHVRRDSLPAESNDGGVPKERLKVIPQPILGEGLAGVAIPVIFVYFIFFKLLHELPVPY